MSGQSVDTKPEVYFCVLCPDDSEVRTFRTQKQLENHLRDTHLKESSSDESHAIDLWLERHVKYQESLNKSMAQSVKTVPDRNKTIYRGCPVCDRIIKVFNIRSDPFPKGSEIHELLVRDINVDYSGNNVNHINPHLKYYPYECLICKVDCEKSRQRGDPDVKEVVKTSVKAMMRRHIIDKHLKDSPLTRQAFENEVEKAILSLKVMVLERVTRKDDQTVKHINKKRKIKSVPGPLRQPTQSEQPKGFLPILPTFARQMAQLNQLNDDINALIIPIASVGPFTTPIAGISCLPIQPLMTSTPIAEKQTASPSEITLESEESFSSEDELSDSEFDLMKDKSEVFGCVFCYKRFKTYDKVFDHYLVHINVFIECAQCDLKFKTIAEFRAHNPRHNENCNLLKLNQYKTVRKWIEKFLDYLKTDRQTLLSLTYDLDRVYCGVCLMVSYVYNFESKNDLPDNVSIESHIHNHMNYFPFECIDCNYEDMKTEFILDAKAKRHLFEKHDIKNTEHMNQTELSTYFVNKNSSIHRLDELIEQFAYITKQRNSFS